MKRGVLYSKLNSGWLKWITIDLICFIVVSALSFGFCYSYFSDEVKASGEATTASLIVEYWQTATSGTPSSTVYAIIDGTSNAVALDSIENDEIVPGQSVTIKGYAVNTSNINVYIMGKLEIEAEDKNGLVKYTETVWYNIGNGQSCNGSNLTIGASSLTASTWVENNGETTITTPDSAKQELSLIYTFDGATFVNGDKITKFNFTLEAHQSSYLTLAEDYDNFSSITNGAVNYSQNQVYAAYCITGLSPAGS